MKLLDALGRFETQMRADGRSPHTVKSYRRHIALLDRWLASTKRSNDLAAIDHETLAVFLGSADARTRDDGGPKCAVTVNALRTALRVFFAYLADADYTPRNAARLVRRARCGPPPPRALSDAEIARLRTELARGHGAATVRDRVLVELLLATGVRLSSALAIDIEDVDLDAGEITLRRVKGDRVQRVFIGRAAHKMLGAFIGARDRGPLFMGNGFRRYETRHAQRRIADWMRQARIPHASGHSLRHSFATRLYQRTGDVLLVKEALGHRSIESTLVYASADETRLRQALAT